MLNDLDRYRLVIDMIDRVPTLGARAAGLRQEVVDARLRASTWTRDPMAPTSRGGEPNVARLSTAGRPLGTVVDGEQLDLLLPSRRHVGDRVPRPMPDQGQPQRAVRGECVRFLAGGGLFLNEHDPHVNGI